MVRRVVDVLVPVALDRAYSYRVPRSVELKAGDVVEIEITGIGTLRNKFVAETSPGNMA